MNEIPKWLQHLGYLGLGIISGNILWEYAPEDIAIGLILPTLLLIAAGLILIIIQIDREIKESRKRIIIRS